MMASSTYVKDDTGATFIPASQRPDGTWRKPRRVRDGYVPQEEVPLYESKGKQWAMSKPQYPVGMCPEVINASKAANESARPIIPGLYIEPKPEASKSSKKKKKKKSASKGTEVDSLTAAVKNTSLNQNKSSSSDKKSPPEQAVTTDPQKRLKNLKKKLKEIEVLEMRIASGELKNPEKEQKNKIERKNQVLSEIEDLELELGTID
ncbi:partner of Y14 and mago [Ischnura elegans]|uniref:partner of Y14 and mago n=1 Tax=Ischnura elegans TaxID=197161 RepID=UPI001ED89B3A|nr:partner of Y14 and mago [Ischnura elegans]